MSCQLLERRYLWKRKRGELLNIEQRGWAVMKTLPQSPPLPFPLIGSRLFLSRLYLRIPREWGLWEEVMKGHCVFCRTSPFHKTSLQHLYFSITSSSSALEIQTRGKLNTSQEQSFVSLRTPFQLHSQNYSWVMSNVGLRWSRLSNFSLSIFSFPPLSVEAVGKVVPKKEPAYRIVFFLKLSYC